MRLKALINMQMIIKRTFFNHGIVLMVFLLNRSCLHQHTCKNRSDYQSPDEPSKFKIILTIDCTQSQVFYLWLPLTWLLLDGLRVESFKLYRLSGPMTRMINKVMWSLDGTWNHWCYGAPKSFQPNNNNTNKQTNKPLCSYQAWIFYIFIFKGHFFSSILKKKSSLYKEREFLTLKLIS